MNQSLQRALNQVSLLKKTLNTQKTSHQNSLQQLQTAYKIIQEMKQLLKTQQQTNKSLNAQLKDKSKQFEQISRQYEQHIVQIKQLIDRKDIEIKRYTQVKVTDYDMIRLRVITEVQAQHSQEIQALKKQIQKQQFLNNENMFQIKVLRQKVEQYQKQLEEQKQLATNKQQQLTMSHNSQMSKTYALLEQQKQLRRQVQKRLEQEKQKYTKTIAKYHSQLQTLQNQVMAHPNKQNSLRQPSHSLINLKQSQFAQQNQKLKRQLKSKSEDLDELTKKHKSEVRELNKKIDELQKQINEKDYQMKQVKNNVQDMKTTIEDQIRSKIKKQHDKKERLLKDKFQNQLYEKDKVIQDREKQLRKINLQLESLKSPGKKPIFPQKQPEQTLFLKKQNQQLKAQLKSTFLSYPKEINLQLTQVKQKPKAQFQGRQVRAVSVQDVKEKLKVANAQILTLLKDKIALNEKISKMTTAK